MTPAPGSSGGRSGGGNDRRRTGGGPPAGRGRPGGGSRGSSGGSSGGYGSRGSSGGSSGGYGSRGSSGGSSGGYGSRGSSGGSSGGYGSRGSSGGSSGGYGSRGSSGGSSGGYGSRGSSGGSSGGYGSRGSGSSGGSSGGYGSRGSSGGSSGGGYGSRGSSGGSSGGYGSRGSSGGSSGGYGSRGSSGGSSGGSYDTRSNDKRSGYDDDRSPRRPGPRSSPNSDRRYGSQTAGYRGSRPEGRPERSGPPASPEGAVWGGIARAGGGYRTDGDRRPPSDRPSRHDEVADSRGSRRAATAGRNLWNPRPEGALRENRLSPRRPKHDAHSLGGEQIEGRQAVRELLAARKRKVTELWLTEGTDPAPILGEIDRLAQQAGVPVRLVSSRRLETIQVTEAPQGVVAFADPLQALTLDELLLDTPPAGGAGGDKGREMAFLVVASGVTDPQNLGAILRSAECAGATGALIPQHRSAHITPAVAKAAAGAVEHLRMALVGGVPAALQDLQRLGVLTVGLDERGSKSIFDMQLGDRPVALVMGAEGSGLAPLVRERCDLMASIPIGGSIPSLNVAAAAAVACYEVARQRAAHNRDAQAS